MCECYKDSSVSQVPGKCNRNLQLTPWLLDGLVASVGVRLSLLSNCAVGGTDRSFPISNIHDNVVAEAWENGWPIGCGDIIIIIVLRLVTWNT